MCDAEQNVLTRPIAEELNRRRADDTAREMPRLSVQAGSAEHHVNASIARIERSANEREPSVFDLRAGVRIDHFQRRDATDVAMVTSFGPCTLTSFKVVTDEVPEAVTGA